MEQIRRKAYADKYWTEFDDIYLIGLEFDV
jgi:hypothetical protein